MLGNTTSFSLVYKIVLHQVDRKALCFLRVLRSGWMLTSSNFPICTAVIRLSALTEAFVRQSAKQFWVGMWARSVNSTPHASHFLVFHSTHFNVTLTLAQVWCVSRISFHPILMRSWCGLFWFSTNLPSTLCFPSSLSSSFSFSCSSPSSSMWVTSTLRTLANEDLGPLAENDPLTGYEPNDLHISETTDIFIQESSGDNRSLNMHSGEHSPFYPLVFKINQTSIWHSVLWGFFTFCALKACNGGLPSCVVPLGFLPTHQWPCLDWLQCTARFGNLVSDEFSVL